MFHFYVIRPAAAPVPLEVLESEPELEGLLAEQLGHEQVLDGMDLEQLGHEPQPPPKKARRLLKLLSSKQLLKRHNSMKQGPTTLEELMEWPRRLCQDIWDGSDGEMRRARAAANLAAGLVLGSEYSGELCAETAICMQCKGMLSHGFNVPINRIVSYSACNVAPVC